MRSVLRKAWRAPFAVSSNFARSHAEYVACAASKGLISTRVGYESYSRTWLITSLGLQWLDDMEEL